LKRLSITLTEEALKIYESWKPHTRSKKVSEAIIEKQAKEHGEVFTLEQVKFIQEEIEKRLERLEGMK
jgi:hypothetical protein